MRRSYATWLHSRPRAYPIGDSGKMRGLLHSVKPFEADEHPADSERVCHIGPYTRRGKAQNRIVVFCGRIANKCALQVNSPQGGECICNQTIWSSNGDVEWAVEEAAPILQLPRCRPPHAARLRLNISTSYLDVTDRLWAVEHAPA
jgi:hypothetical protein